MKLQLPTGTELSNTCQIAHLDSPPPIDIFKTYVLNKISASRTMSLTLELMCFAMRKAKNTMLEEHENLGHP